MRLAQGVIVTSSNEKGQKAREPGAEEIINSKTTRDWGERSSKVDQSQRSRPVAGGSWWCWLNDSVQATKVTGQIAVIGFLAGQPPI